MMPTELHWQTPDVLVIIDIPARHGALIISSMAAYLGVSGIYICVVYIDPTSI